MAPKLEDQPMNLPPKNFVLYMAALLPTGPLSDDDEEEEEIESVSEEDSLSEPPKIAVPLEQNLRGLLMQVTGTEDLATVTQVKLRVIARDVPLQHLHLHIPALRELILDGSVLFNFRDLGCGLKNLRVLRVNRCGIECLEGMSGLEGLEELFASDNYIEDLIPCAFLPNIKVIDMKRNRLRNVWNALTFLTLCEQLEHIHLEGNDEVWQFPNYRQTVKCLLPTLRSLDGIMYSSDDDQYKSSNLLNQQQLTPNTGGNPPNTSQLPNTTPGNHRGRHAPPDISTSFTIRFPPKVFLDRPASNK